jgi:hypothetical protein
VWKVIDELGYHPEHAGTLMRIAKEQIIAERAEVAR